MGAREKVAVFGGSGHAKVVIDIIEKQGRFEIAALFDDDPALAGTTVFGYLVAGGKKELIASGLKRGIVAIGNNAARRSVADWLRGQGIELVSAVHPAAQLARGVTVGSGCAIMAGAVVNSDTVIGEDVIVNTRASIDHDCTIGAGVHVAPGATLCGTVEVGEESFLCAGVTVIPNLRVGSRCTVGAGSTVIADLPDRVLAVGSPARVVRQR